MPWVVRTVQRSQADHANVKVIGLDAVSWCFPRYRLQVANMRASATALVHNARVAARLPLKGLPGQQLAQARLMSAVAAAHAKPVDGFSGAVGNTPLVRSETFCIHNGIYLWDSTYPLKYATVDSTQGSVGRNWL